MQRELCKKEKVWASEKFIMTKVFDPSISRGGLHLVQSKPTGSGHLSAGVFTGTRVGSGMFWLGGIRLSLPDAGAKQAQDLCLAADTGVFEPQEAVPQALILSGGARLIAWHLRHLF